MAKSKSVARTLIAASISSGILKQCPFCRKFSLDGIDNFVPAARHLQDEHGLECLHIGTETTNDENGRPWHLTVAYFGSVNPPKELPLPSIRITVKRIGQKDARETLVVDGKNAPKDLEGK